AGALLPDTRLVRGVGGPGPGDLPARLEGCARVRGTVHGAGVAVPDRDERVPRRPRRPRPPGAAAPRGAAVGPDGRAAAPYRRAVAPAVPRPADRRDGPA